MQYPVQCVHASEGICCLHSLLECIAMQAFTAEQESPLLLQHEFHLVQTAPAAPDMDNFSLKANSITREVIAVMEIEDGAVLEMVIKLPTSSPLRRAEVACRKRVSPLALTSAAPLELQVVNSSLCAVRDM